jgi:hypothetical protein
VDFSTPSGKHYNSVSITPLPPTPPQNNFNLLFTCHPSTRRLDATRARATYSIYMSVAASCLPCWCFAELLSWCPGSPPSGKHITHTAGSSQRHCHTALLSAAAVPPCRASPIVIIHPHKMADSSATETESASDPAYSPPSATMSLQNYRIHFS